MMREVSHVYVEQVARFTDNNRLVRSTSRITVMILSFRTPKAFVVITLKFELCGFTID